MRWYCYDGLGSVLGEVAPDGTLTRAQSYDVYGLVRTSAGQATTRHKFVGALGHPSEDETGLVYMRARYYDPVTGRFASEDLAGDGGNWFAYCDGDPVNGTDHDGRSWQAITYGLTIGVGLIAGYSVGYVFMVMLLESLHPGYTGGRFMLGSLLMALGQQVWGMATGLRNPKDPLPNPEAGRAIKTINDQLKSSSGVGLLGAFGMGFLPGLLMGIASATYEYYASDYYQQGDDRS